MLYQSIPFKHDHVNHVAGEYVRDEISTNSIVSFSALMKRSYKGLPPLLDLQTYSAIPGRPAGTAQQQTPVNPQAHATRHRTIRRQTNDLPRTDRTKLPSPTTGNLAKAAG